MAREALIVVKRGWVFIHSIDRRDLEALAKRLREKGVDFKLDIIYCG